MSDYTQQPQQTTWTPPPMASDEGWNLPSMAEANRVVWDDSFDGVDGYFELTNLGEVAASPYKKRDPQGNPIYEKDPITKQFILDENGDKIQAENLQSTWTWTILELDHPKSDEVIGQTINGWYTHSMNIKGKMYEAIKAIVGGAVEPGHRYLPSELRGGVVKATIELGDPKGTDGRRWPKLTNHRVARGYTPRVAVDDVPF